MLNKLLRLKTQTLDILDDRYTHLKHKNIFLAEGIDLDRAAYVLSPQYQADRLEYLKSIVPLDKLDQANDTPGRIDKYTSVSHHVWVTDMNNNPRDIVTYRSTVQQENKYTDDKTKISIDDPYNSFIQSIKNLDEGSIKANVQLSEGKWHHVIWTNFSREDLVNHPELTSLRKICGIDPVPNEIKAAGFPEFIVININDVMDKDANAILNIANPSTALPQVIKDGFLDMKQDLLSVRNALEDFKSKKMMASISDVVRIAAIKDIGGMYFDLDHVIFDQELVHTQQHKYNLFDIIKNYRLIVGNEGADFCNGIISVSTAHILPLIEAWEVITKNINSVTIPDYLRNIHQFHKILQQTGPVAFTNGVIKALDDTQDIGLNNGVVFYYCADFTNPHSIITDGDIGSISYDICGWEWGL